MDRSIDNKLATRCSFSLAAVISASRNAKCAGIDALMYSLMSRSILSSSSPSSIISRLFIADTAHKRERGGVGWAFILQPTFCFRFLDSNSIASSQIKPAPREERIDRLYRPGSFRPKYFLCGESRSVIIATRGGGGYPAGVGSSLRANTQSNRMPSQNFLTRRSRLEVDSYGTVMAPRFGQFWCTSKTGILLFSDPNRTLEPLDRTEVAENA